MGEVVDLFSRARIRLSNQGESFNGEAQRVQQPSAMVSNGLRDFETIARENAELQERLRKERASANKNVLKSYRIK